MGFRRLTYHRSYFMVVLGVVTLVAVGAYVAETMWSNPADNAFVVGLGAALGLVMLARGLTGQWSSKQLYVDIRAGKLRLLDGSIYALDELGPLTIEKKLLPPPNRHRVHEHLLRAANVKYYLFEAIFEGETQRRYDALDAAVLEYRIRRVLERPQGEGAFRSGPDPDAEILEIAGTRERAAAALQLLARDPDKHIREQASARLAQLR